MKKIVLSVAALALTVGATVGSAFAADLPSRKGPPMLPAAAAAAADVDGLLCRSERGLWLRHQQQYAVDRHRPSALHRLWLHAEY